jgi:hypothetical protein
VAKVKNHDMWESVETAHADLGFAAIKEYGVSSSARQVNQSASKNKKTVDRTVVYSRKD